MRFIFFVVYCLFSFIFNSFSQNMPAGYVMTTSDCASGGYDYHFFANNEVVKVWTLSRNPNPIEGGIEKGTRKPNAKGKAEITFHTAVSFEPAKNAKIVAVAAQTIYDLYEAKITQKIIISPSLSL